MVTALLSVWTRVGDEDKKGLDRDDALRAFTALVNGETLVEKVEEVPRKWVPAKTYSHLTTVARVRSDYDPGPDGWKLNGRIGSVQAVRRGNLILHFDDGLEGAPVEFRSDINDFEVDIYAYLASAEGNDDL